MSLRINSAKADIYNAGTSRNHFRSGDDICVVGALARMKDFFPERFAEEADQPLFRMKDGSPLWRSEIQGLVQAAAEKQGFRPVAVCDPLSQNRRRLCLAPRRGERGAHPKVGQVGQQCLSGLPMGIS